MTFFKMGLRKRQSHQQQARKAGKTEQSQEGQKEGDLPATPTQRKGFEGGSGPIP
jgi:hypothetical protein